MKILLLAILVVFVVGCLTSKPFKLAESSGIPNLVKDCQHYAGVDLARQAQCGSLLAADGGTAEQIKSAWTPVRAWYVPAVQADLKLSPIEQQLRSDDIAKMDALIAAEQARPLR